MKLVLISIGKAHEPAFRDAIVDFTERISHYMPVEWKLFKEESDVDEKILKSLGAEDYLVALDEYGVEVTSVELADMLTKRLNASTKNLVIVIGGAYGLSEKILSRAGRAVGGGEKSGTTQNASKQSTSSGRVISLSKLTFPHQLVRLILAEQLYRACTIMKSEKYHHQ